MASSRSLPAAGGDGSARPRLRSRARPPSTQPDDEVTVPEPATTPAQRAMEASTLETAAAAAERRIIDRPRLTKILDESNARFLLLIAPAGYGKTTLARQWLRDKPHVWYQADRSSSDPAALAKGLERAFGVCDPANPTISELLRANPSLGSDPRELADALGELVERRPGSVLAIDDYQLVAEAPSSESFVRHLAENTCTRLLLTTRIRPSWLRPRDLLYGDALELTAEHLAMTGDETRALLGETRATCPRLLATAAGWPILLALAAEVGQVGGGDISSPSHLYEYLTGEVLRDLPDAVGRLLGDMAVAPSLGERAVRNHPDLVSEAVRRGLLREEDGSLQMHPRLAEFLQERWFAENDEQRAAELCHALIAERRWDDAFALAERTHQPEYLARLLCEGGFDLLDEGRVQTVQRWLRVARREGYAGAIVELLTADLSARRGRLREARASALAAAEGLVDAHLRYRAHLVAGRASYQLGEHAEAAHAFGRASRDLGSAETREAIVGLAMTAIQVEDDDYKRLLTELDDAADDDETRLRTVGAALFAFSRFGPVVEGLRAAERVAVVATRVRNPWARSAFAGIHAYLLDLAGDYERAMTIARAALADATRARLEFAVVQIHLQLARIHIGLGDYATANRLVRQSLATGRTAAAESHAATATTLRLRLLIEQGLTEEAVSEPEPTHLGTTHAAASELMAARAFSYACVGDVAMATELTEQARTVSRNIEAGLLTQACRLIADEEREPEHAKALVSLVRHTGNIDSCVWVVRGSKRVEDAVTVIAAGDDDDALLARRILALAKIPFIRARHPTREQELSPRERDVFALLQQGLANRQIAKALFISEATVKVHLRRIYRKLGVTNRTQAVLICDPQTVSATPPQGRNN
jgi:ATP/maltotriose-dependent transcriptional regulator MalT